MYVSYERYMMLSQCTVSNCVLLNPDTERAGRHALDHVVEQRNFVDGVRVFRHDDAVKALKLLCDRVVRIFGLESVDPAGTQPESLCSTTDTVHSNRSGSRAIAKQHAPSARKFCIDRWCLFPWMFWRGAEFKQTSSVMAAGLNDIVVRSCCRYSRCRPHAVLCVDNGLDVPALRTMAGQAAPVVLQRTTLRATKRTSLRCTDHILLAGGHCMAAAEISDDHVQPAAHAA